MFEPIETDRLIIRAVADDDVDHLVDVRNDPAVAEYQDWDVPFPRERAERIVASCVELGGPADEDWWVAIVDDKQTGETLGDLAVHVTNDFRSIEVGYTFRAETWGNGYAVESVAALIERLWEDRRLLRVYGMLHPANRASAQVLERVGMKFEGHTRLSFWGRGEGSDDWIYGMTREDWERWRDRPTGQPTAVALVAITSDNQREVAELETHHSQRSFVAPVRVSYGDALFPGDWDGMPVSPWMRAITADDEYAGFVMMHLSDDGSEPYLWRFLIDRNHQRRGIGRRALDLVVDACRTVGANSMRVSWVPGRGSPEPFYLGYGFEPTGVMHDTELEARLRFPDFTR